MDTLYTFWDITHCKTESVHFLGLLNSAAKKGTILEGSWDLVRRLYFITGVISPLSEVILITTYL